MSDKHTQGTIRYDYERGYCGELVASNGVAIATFDDEPRKANARRLVACWNAAEGLSTESLESAGNAFNGWKLASYAMNDAKAQRDELLATLKELLSGIFDGPDESDAARLIAKARAAIAKAEASK